MQNIGVFFGLMKSKKETVTMAVTVSCYGNGLL